MLQFENGPSSETGAGNHTREETAGELCGVLASVQFRRLQFENLVERLRGEDPSQRAGSAAQLAGYGDWAVEPLTSLLDDNAPTVRAAAVRALGEVNDERVLPPLCRMLRDKDPEVRIAAAEGLGRLADPRAIQPLVEALQRCSLGRSAQRQRVLGGLLIACVVVALGAYLGGMLLAAKLGASAIMFVVQMSRMVDVYLTRRRQQSRVGRAITEALASIAEQSAAPELRNALPELRGIAADVLQQEKETRKASVEVAARIEALTERLQNLPVAASAPHTRAEALPLPAENRTTPAEQLPRVST